MEYSVTLVPVEPNEDVLGDITSEMSLYCDSKDYGVEELSEQLDMKTSPKMRSVEKTKESGEDFLLKVSFDMLDEIEDRCQMMLEREDYPADLMSYLNDLQTELYDTDVSSAVIWENIDITSYGIQELLETDTSGLSGKTKNFINKKCIIMLPTIISGKYAGSYYQAFSGLCSVSSSYAEPKNCPENCIVWLRLNDSMTVCVGFLADGQGHVLVTASFCTSLTDDVMSELTGICENSSTILSSELEKWQ